MINKEMMWALERVAVIANDIDTHCRLHFFSNKDVFKAMLEAENVARSISTIGDYFIEALMYHLHSMELTEMEKGLANEYIDAIRHSNGNELFGVIYDASIEYVDDIIRILNIVR